MLNDQCISLIYVTSGHLHVETSKLLFSAKMGNNKVPPAAKLAVTIVLLGVLLVVILLPMSFHSLEYYQVRRSLY